MNAYYNEIDPYAAQWLRNLIAAGHIAPGVVDERDVRDVSPSNLSGFTQCHFFAGVGIWSYALRSAGWRDDKPVWTASCPCQPFSAAGAGAGVDDERHLWPVIHWLAEQCRPETILGEQVASIDGLGWFDIVSSDMEAADYAIGAIDTCAAGFGAPHIRQRLYFAAENLRPDPKWLADADGTERRPQADGQPIDDGQTGERNESSNRTGKCRATDRVANTESGRCNERAGLSNQEQGSRRAELTDGSSADRVGNTSGPRSKARIPKTVGCREGNPEISDNGSDRLSRSDAGRSASVGMADAGGLGLSEGRSSERTTRHDGPLGNGAVDRSGPLYGPWANADWLFCRDGKWRPVEPGTFPLAHGATSRMGRLRAYGNGLCAEQATGFIRAYMDRGMADLSEQAGGDLFEWGI